MELFGNPLGGYTNMSNQYRNLNDITSSDGEEVEAGSLWALINEEYILVDDDRHVSSEDHKAFAKA